MRRPTIPDRSASRLARRCGTPIDSLLTGLPPAPFRAVEMLAFEHATDPRGIGPWRASVASRFRVAGGRVLHDNLERSP